MLCLPPHTTHETQPLDCGVFRPLKSHWSAVCHDFIQKNPAKAIAKFNFNLLFWQAWLRALTPSNLIAGFKTCGVYPLDPLALNVSIEGNEDTSSSVVEESSFPLDTSISRNERDSSPQFTDEQEELFKRR